MAWYYQFVSSGLCVQTRSSLKGTQSNCWISVCFRKVQPETLAIYPNYDYLADIQDSLLEMDGKIKSRKLQRFLTA